MAKPYQHLTLSNRILIEHERCKGSSCQNLAQMLKVHRTTIARELRRNSPPNGRYDHQQAHQRAQCRRTVARSQRRPKTAELWDEFAQTLRQHPRQMSPELYHGRTTQVEGRVSLKVAHGCTNWYIGIDTTVETSISVYLAKVENIANDCPVMPVAAKSRTGLISTNDRRLSIPATPLDTGKWTLSSATATKECY